MPRHPERLLAPSLTDLAPNIRPGWVGGEDRHPPLPPLDMAEPVDLLWTDLLPFRPKDLFPRLLAAPYLVLRQKTSAGWTAIPSCTTTKPGQLESPRPEVGPTLPVDPGALCEHLVDLVSHLPPLLPDSCEWLDQGALEVVGGRPIDAGGIADIWVGMMGSRKVAIKSYRYCSDYLPNYVVSNAWPMVYPVDLKPIGRGSTKRPWRVVASRTRISYRLLEYVLLKSIHWRLSSISWIT